MEKTNLEKLTERSREVPADIAGITAQRETRVRRDKRFRVRTPLNFALLCVGLAVNAYGQTTDPWSTAVGQLAAAFTGPIAKGLSLVAIVLGGITIAFSEGNHSRVVGGLIFGVGLAISAASFLTWITT